MFFSSVKRKQWLFWKQRGNDEDDCAEKFSSASQASQQRFVRMKLYGAFIGYSTNHKEKFTGFVFTIDRTK